MSWHQNSVTVSVFSVMQSWLFELGAVLSLSLAGNLYVAHRTATSPQGGAWPWAIVCWIVFGGLFLYFSKYFRGKEAYYTKENNSGRTLARKVAKDFARVRCHVCLFVASMVFLAAGIILLY